MSRRGRILLVVLLVILATAALLYPRLRRTLEYIDFVSKPRAAARLAVMPASMDAGAPPESVQVSTRWATFSVPANLLTEMTAHETWLRIDGKSDTSVLLTELHYETQFTADGNYSFYDAAAHAAPLPAIDVFLMSDHAFEEHLKLIIAKFGNGFRDRGVSLFETKHVKGMIYHGGPASPNVIEIHIWHALQPVSEIIAVSSQEHEVRESVARSIAASFRFTLDAVPDGETLLNMARDSADAFNSAG